MHASYSKSMLSNILDRIKLSFRKDKELYLSLYKIIGFYPHNIELYKTALLHKSIARKNEKGKPVNNERLEFLGDAILGAVVGDIVFEHFPGKREGFLTNTRSKLVKRETLNKLADEMGIKQMIISNGHSSSHNSYMGGNAFEALVGAIYLDRGYYACMKFVQNRIKLNFVLLEQKIDNNGSPIVSYRVDLEGVEGCSGSGYSKKESQQLASKYTLEDLRKKPQFIDEVFAAKAERTKMEEMPVMTVPDTENKDNFIIVQDKSDHDLSSQEAEDENLKLNDLENEIDEFDLSSISAKAMSREEIIAAAEAAAFAEEN